MSDERPSHNPAALDEATDRVIREMTQVALSDDAVTRVMSRIRAARGLEPAPSPRGWFGALLEPRISWGAAAAAAAVAAIVATGATAFVLRNDRSNTPSAPLIAAAAGATHMDQARADRTLPSARTGAASTAAPAAHAATDAALATRADQARADRALPSAQAEAASTAAPAAQAATDAAAAPRVARVERARRSGVGKAAVGIDPGVTAASVATPDEEQPRGQEAGRAVPQDVRLDVTIHDQSGSAKAVAKTVSMVVADRENGSIRSETRMPFKQSVGVVAPNAPAPVERWDTETLPLDVDAWPTILADGRVRVRLIVSYRTASTPVGAVGAPMATSMVKKNIFVVLTDGKPLVISESADAATDRKVTLEVKATIQK